MKKWSTSFWEDKIYEERIGKYDRIILWKISVIAILAFCLTRYMWYSLTKLMLYSVDICKFLKCNSCYHAFHY